MATEIERKFLLRHAGCLAGVEGIPIVQGYIAKETMMVRVRTMGPLAFLTLKGPFRGIARDEFEYEIPLPDAQELLALYCGREVVTKTRYHVSHAGHLFEVDVFHGRLKGLAIAEVELASEQEEVSLPDWVGEEVTGDLRFGNRALSLMEASPLPPVPGLDLLQAG